MAIRPHRRTLEREHPLMPHAPDRPPLDVATVDDVVAALRAAGHRVSASARAVLDALFAADGAVSAERIAGGELELTSVYRNLDRLQHLGVVTHLHVGHGPGLYALAREGGRDYLVCERCDRVTSLDPAELDTVRAYLRTRFGHHARFSHFPIHGYCESCAGIIDVSQPREKHVPDDHTHSHDHPHAHEHSHGDLTHSHAHSGHDHGHVEHDHEHSHGDIVHSHSHVHEPGLEHDHEHSHHH
jgi:Fur family ferric uptake transcriptional regulator